MADAAAGALATFGLRTLNVRGLERPDKLAALVADAVQAPVSVHFIQETHLKISPFESARLTRGADISWPGHCFHSPGNGKAAGCLTLIRHSPTLTDLQQVTLPAAATGRVLRVDGHLRGVPVSLINVYAPAHAPDQLPFYRDVLPLCLPARGHREILMGGDFNVLCHAIDYMTFAGLAGHRGHDRAMEPAARALHALMQGGADGGGPWLVDAWRTQHPDTADFTCLATHRRSATRLDRWLVSAGLLHMLSDCSIDTVLPVATDHFPVTVRLQLPQPVLFGPGLARIPPTLYDDQAVHTAVKALLTQAVAALAAPPPPDIDPGTWHRVLWHRTKTQVRQLMLDAKRARRRAERARARQLRMAAAAARDGLLRMAGAQAPPADVAAAVTLLNVTASASVPQRQQQAEAAMRSGAVLSQFYNDRPTYYFHSKVKAPHAPVVMRSLKVDEHHQHDLSSAAGTAAALDAFTSHYSADNPVGVFAARACDLQARQRLLAIPGPKLSAAQAALAEGPDGSSMLTAAELRRALMACARDTAPGQDGLSIEFYLQFWELVAPLMVAALREAFHDADSPAPLALFLFGVITLVPKPGKPADEILGYRPITLLDMDTRIIARAIADRLQIPLDLVIAPTQAAFILGRDISDNIQYHLCLADYLQARAPHLWVCLWDLAGAYDHVNWGLLQDSMLAMGFRDQGHVRWARMLHQGATCSVRLNGWLSPRFPLASGLLQGSGASPLYWCIALQPLTNYLNSLAVAGRILTPLIPRSTAPQADALQLRADPSQTYADDCQTLGEDPASVDSTTAAFREWESVGGAPLSLGPRGKSKGYQQAGQAAAILAAAAPPLAPAPAQPAAQAGVAAALAAAAAAAAHPAAPEPPGGLKLIPDGRSERLLGVPVGPGLSYAAQRAAVYQGKAAAFTGAAQAWASVPLSLPGRTHVAKQCLASKTIFQLAYTQPDEGQLRTMQASIRHFVAAHTQAQGDVPPHLSSAIFPAQPILAMPADEGGMGYPMLSTFATAMQAKLIAQLPGPRLSAYQPLARSLLAEPVFGVVSWVITQPSAVQLPPTLSRLQDHVTAFSQLHVHRVKLPSEQGFFSILAEPLLYNPAIDMDMAAALTPAQGGPGAAMGWLAGCPAVSGWRYLRDVYATMHAPGVLSLAVTAAVRAVLTALPAPWRSAMQLHPPPLPRFSCASVPATPTCPASYLVRGRVVRDGPVRTFWMSTTGQLLELLPGDVAPLGDRHVALDALQWEPAAVALVRASPEQLTPEEAHQQNLPAADRPPWPQRPRFLGPWRSVWIDPTVWGWFTPGAQPRPISLVDYTVKRARARLTAAAYQRYSAALPGARYQPATGIFPKLWGTRPAAPPAVPAGQPAQPVPWDSTGLQVLEQRWRQDWLDQLATQHHHAIAAAGGFLHGEQDAALPPAWMDLQHHPDPARAQRMAARAQRVAQLAEQQEFHQLPPAQPALQAAPPDPAAAAANPAAPPPPPPHLLTSGIDCRRVWRSLLHPTLRVQDRVVAWLVLHGCLLVRALQLHCSKHVDFPAARACCPTCVTAMAPAQLETLSHAFLDCPAVAPALDWLLQVYAALTGQPAPPRDPLVILAAADWIWHPATGTHYDLWTLLRVTYLGCVWAARCTLDSYGGAAAIAQAVIAALTDGVHRDWARVTTNVVQGAAGVFPTVWFRGRSPQIDLEHFQRLWPLVGEWYQIQDGVLTVRFSQDWPVPVPM
jgi:exonuclease III